VADLVNVTKVDIFAIKEHQPQHPEKLGSLCRVLKKEMNRPHASLEM
jgi:hypothetical protein